MAKIINTYTVINGLTVETLHPISNLYKTNNQHLFQKRIRLLNDYEQE